MKNGKNILIVGTPTAPKGIAAASEHLLSKRQKTSAELWKAACDNRNLLDGCKKHKFSMPKDFKLGSQLECENCGGKLDLVGIFRYCQGFEAAGGDADEILPGFRKPIKQDEEKK